MLIWADDVNGIFPESEKTLVSSGVSESSVNKDQTNFQMVITSVKTNIC